MFKIEIDIDLKFQNLITMHGISDDLEPKVKLHIFEKKDISKVKVCQGRVSLQPLLSIKKAFITNHAILCCFIDF